MKETLRKIELIKRNGYSFGLGEIIEQSFNNYKKIALIQGLVIMIVIIIFTVVIGSVAGIAIGVGTLTEYFTDYNVNDVTSVTLLINFAVSVIAAGIFAPFTAGLLKMAHEAEENRSVEFSAVFDYYKSSYLKNLFLSGVLISLFLSGFSTLIGLLSQSYSIGILSIGLSIISFILNVTVPILTIFAIPLIIFGNLSATEAVMGSITVAISKFWYILVIVFLFGICAILGFFGFCIGIFFTIPILYSAIYIMYRTAIGIDEKTELDEIGVTKY